uniref:Iodothyronine deiodinase n=1 Tax=Oryzias latipes TaxID=8090 RepID=A0A3P9MJN2_ORYLA
MPQQPPESRAVAWERQRSEGPPLRSLTLLPAEMMDDSSGVQMARALKQAALCLMLLPRFLLAAVMLWLLDFLCIRRKMLLKMGERQDSPDDPPLCVSDSNKMFTLESLRAVWHGQKLDVLKTAQLGQTAPNTEVVLVQERRQVRILDCMKGNRPLILNFGSYIADFLVVYIEEAHPSDGWVSSDAPHQIPKHRCLEDRLRAAALMLTEVPGSKVVVDNMDNSSNAAYGAYFERLYIVRDETVVYQGGRGPEEYRISELKTWLQQYRKELLNSQNAVLHV